MKGKALSELGETLPLTESTRLPSTLKLELWNHVIYSHKSVKVPLKLRVEGGREKKQVASAFSIIQK